jgi:phthalate 3,4-dioxygenase subunit beta
MLYRSRGNVREAALVSAGRVAVLRDDGDVRPTISVDESATRMQNLAAPW